MSKKPNAELIDEDNPEWTDEMFKQSVRLNALPESLQAKLRGRPKAAVTKERITIRLSPEVVERFRASGAGWQTRVDAALKEWLGTHSKGRDMKRTVNPTAGRNPAVLKRFLAALEMTPLVIPTVGRNPAVLEDFSLCSK